MGNELRSQLEVVHPLDDIRPIFLIDAQHFTQREHWQLGREHLGEVDLRALPLHII